MSEQYEYIIETEDGQVNLKTHEHHSTFISLKHWYEKQKPFVKNAINRAASTAAHEFTDIKVWEKEGEKLIRLK